METFLDFYISCFLFFLLDLPFLVHPSIILWLILKIKINDWLTFWFCGFFLLLLCLKSNQNKKIWKFCQKHKESPIFYSPCRYFCLAGPNLQNIFLIKVFKTLATLSTPASIYYSWSWFKQRRQHLIIYLLVRLNNMNLF